MGVKKEDIVILTCLPQLWTMFVVKEIQMRTTDLINFMPELPWKNEGRKVECRKVTQESLVFIYHGWKLVHKCLKWVNHGHINTI